MSGRLADNILHFARTLRRAGLKIGPGDVVDAVNAVQVVGLSRRDDFYWTLFAIFVKRRQDQELFDYAFHIFWKDPDLLRRMMSLLLPRLTIEGEERATPPRRLQEALGENPPPKPPAPTEQPQEITLDMALTFSEQEKLGRMDFEQMSADEFQEACRLVAQMDLPAPKLLSRRSRPSPRGQRVDLHASLRRSFREGGEIMTLQRRARQWREPPLVALCDISGSMERYARVFLQFLHAMANERKHFHAFVFGTRLTNITRQIRNKDPDVALREAGTAVADWSGGTRIGQCIEDFNRLWSRRVLGQGATVLLMTDGLDQAAAEGLEEQIERLHRSCRRLIWLNPLLRWDGFEPKAAGVRAILPHVDEFRPVHNLNSLRDLIGALS